MRILERAVFIDDIAALLIADLHIGYEEELQARGIVVPWQWEEMRRRIIELMQDTGARKLIILGDIKHDILSKPFYIRKFFEGMDYEIMAVKGNHDGGIEDIVSFPVHPASGFRLGRYGFLHGHSWPSEDVMSSEILFMGHMHPEVELLDSMGKSHRMPCFLMGELNDKGKEKYGKKVKIVVLPAFNPLVGASIGKPIGPLFKNGLVEDMDVYLLNGTYLGKYSEFQRRDLDE
ncbi:phosphoesterase [Euryarchaeota archaeon ex4484_178]|nr:MAG: phosphoesterase [Euryarchaeota archaeon ex4484_178]